MITSPEDLLKLDDTALLATWVSLDEQLKKLKNLENVSRTLCIDKFYPKYKENVNTSAQEIIREGTFELNVGGGYSLVAVKKLGYKLDAEESDIDHLKECMCMASEQGRDLSEKVFKKKYVLDVKEYHTLPKYLKELVDNVIVIDDAKATLTLKKLKERK